MNGYYDFKSTCGYVTGAYVREDISARVGYTLECECCGKPLKKWLSVNYVDENDNEIEEIYGVSCFKKISVKSKIIEL